jgi:hypothetical protein
MEIQKRTGLRLSDAVNLHAQASSARDTLAQMNDWNNRMKAIQRIADPREKMAAEDALSREILSRVSEDDAYLLPEFTDNDRLLKMIVSDSVRTGEVVADPYVYLEAYSRTKLQTTWVFQAEQARVRAEGRVRDQMEPLRRIVGDAEDALGRAGLASSTRWRVAPLSELVDRVNAANPGNSFIRPGDAGHVVSLVVTFSGDPGPNPVERLRTQITANDPQGLIGRIETRGNDLHITMEDSGETFRITVQTKDYNPALDRLAAQAQKVIDGMPDTTRKAVKAMRLMGLMTQLRGLYGAGNARTRGLLGEQVLRLLDDVRFSREDGAKTLEDGLKDLTYRFGTASRASLPS